MTTAHRPASPSHGPVPAQRSPRAQEPDQSPAVLQELARSLRGELALPGTPRYAGLARAFNAAVEQRPVAVAAVADAYDVASTVRIAGRHGLRVAVQCTGHGAAASLDDAVLVHTGALDEVVVHREGWARVGAGVRWREVVEAAAPFGLTPLAGSSTGVGVVGYTTGGGLGPLGRTYGLASDRVRALDVVTGDGRLVRATPTEHEDLFWALRGGRGSAGIVTAVEFDLVPLQTVYGGAVHFAAQDVPAVLAAWRTWASALPETATSSLALQQLPPLPHVPPALAGAMTVAVRLASTGTAEQGAALLAPLRAVATPVLDRTGMLPVTSLDEIHLDPTSPVPVRSAATLLADLAPATVDALLRVAGPGSGSPLVSVELRQLGGALGRPGAHPSAVCGREAGFVVMGAGLRLPHTDAAVAATCSALVTALEPWSTGATLPNFGGGARAYDASTLDRLRSVVLTRDPGRVLVAADPLFEPLGL